ncbi:MAG: 4'-phosphopantetheinyl transferase superfamily protein [Rhizobacter sp.]|jgi:4'-phosphopantetheinyl transferase
MSGASLPPDLTAPLQIHWTDLDTAGPADALAVRVSADERARADRFATPVLRVRHLAVHAWKRERLAAATDQAPLGLQFDTGPFGKPALRGPRAIAFNLSHSEHLAVLAMAPSGHIGVDIERLQPMADAALLASHHFTVAEQAELAALPPADQTRAFLLGWTRKEACMKAAGCGLQVEPSAIETGLSASPRRVSFKTPHGRFTAEVRSLASRDDAIVSWAWA